ncbi:MAG: helix-turn-helix domain-containing protein [Candidatus Nanoarchaeia archaeon]|nr:helix-turn-helix domain-containing protein [Candidatus Nanoarchaeia archaeon]MDD5741528.1 helix-turn-helix domain-containing protein [Candidatus Nanoarchaeia archaeon]
MEEQLKEFGLNDKETKVYLSLLALGEASVNEISEKADLVRTTTYDILKGLREKGIVGSVVKNKILYFEAANPKKLIQILDEKKRKILEVLKDLQGLKTSKADKPHLELYEGKEGIKTVYQDILDKKEDLCSISNTHFIFNVLPYYVPHFVNQRAKSKIFIRLLNEKTEESINLMKKRDKKENRETRFIPELKDIPITEYIYGENVAILGTNPNEPSGIIIRNKDFAKAQKLMFELLWKLAKK